VRRRRRLRILHGFLVRERERLESKQGNKGIVL